MSMNLKGKSNDENLKQSLKLYQFIRAEGTTTNSIHTHMYVSSCQMTCYYVALGVKVASAI